MPGSGSGRTRITGSPSRTCPSRTTQAFSAKRPPNRRPISRKNLGIALERIGIKSIEGLSGMREYGTAVPGSGSAIDRFSTAENTSRSEVLCQPEVRADPEHRGEGLDQFPIDPDLETASEKYSRQVAGQARRAIFDIVADDFYAVYSQKNTALFTHAPLGV